MRKPPTVFVSAPQGAGKSRNAEALRAMFGCTSILDDEDWDGNSEVPAGALVLTNRPLVQRAANDDTAPAEGEGELGGCAPGAVAGGVAHAVGEDHRADLSQRDGLGGGGGVRRPVGVLRGVVVRVRDDEAGRGQHQGREQATQA